MEPNVEFQLLHNDAKPPTRQSKGSVGYDISSIENVEIPPQSIRLVDTGLALKCITEGFFPQLLSRSGLATKNSCFCCCGTIDNDFLNQRIKVVLHNASLEEKVIIKKGDRIAQMVFFCLVHPKSETLIHIDRHRKGGLGSTGI